MPKEADDAARNAEQSRASDSACKVDKEHYNRSVGASDESYTKSSAAAKKCATSIRVVSSESEA